MKVLNLLCAAVVCVGILYKVSLPKAPPDDPWFNSAVTNCSRPVLVKFGAEWCPPCRHMEGVLDQVQPRLSGRVKIVRIDVDQKPHLARHYGVSSIPRIFLFKEGKIIGTSGGFVDAEQVENWVKKHTR